MKFPGFSWPSGGNHSDSVPLQQRRPWQNSKGMDQKIRYMKNFPCNNVNSQHLVNWDVFNNLNIKWSILRLTWTQRKNPLWRRLGLLISLLLFFQTLSSLRTDEKFGGCYFFFILSFLRVIFCTEATFTLIKKTHQKFRPLGSVFASFQVVKEYPIHTKAWACLKTVSKYCLKLFSLSPLLTVFEITWHV